MKIKLTKLRIFLFSLIVFFISFNNFKSILPGEIFGEASYYFLIAFIYFEIFNSIKNGGKILITKTMKNYQKIVLIILLFILVSFILNFGNILFNNFKGQRGLTRFVWQFIIYILTFIIQVLFFSNFFKEFSIAKLKIIILKPINISISIIAFFGFFQYLSSYYSMNLFFLIKWINFLPFAYIEPNIGINRLMIFSREPSYFVNYLVFCFPFLILQLKEQRFIKNYLRVLVCFILIFVSDSRIGLIIVVFQIILYMHRLFRDKKIKTQYLLRSINVIILIFTIIITLFFTNKKVNEFVLKKIERFDFTVSPNVTTSNSTRYYSTLAGVKVGIENPIFGVGLGQNGYYICKNIPQNVKRNNYEIRTFNCNCKEKLFPMAYSLPIRIFSELGLIGFFLFSFLFIYILKIGLNVLKKTKYSQDNEFAFTILVVFCSLFLFSFQIDSFRFITLWIVVSLILYLNEYRFKTNN